MIRKAVLIALSLGGAGCHLAFELFPPDWGTYSSSDPTIPSCPPAPELIVNSLDGELDGGTTITDATQAGPTLSLVEAIWIANNQPGPHTIRFDEIMFSKLAPATILLSSSDAFPTAAIPSVCIDGRDRGVVIDWDDATGLCVNCIWKVGAGSLMTGLTLLKMPYELAVFGGQVAGCRFRTDGYTASYGQRPWAVDANTGAVIGPGNVIAGNVATRVSTTAAPFAQVIGNDFGRDPLTGATLAGPGDSAIQLDAPAVVDDNVFSTELPMRLTFQGPSTVPFVVRNNRFGVDRDGAPITADVLTIDTGNSFGVVPFTLGPNNILRDVNIIVPPAAFQMTRNSFYGRGGLTFNAPPLVAPPQLRLTSATELAVTCSVAGTIEVFADPADLGETFLSDAPCIPGQDTTISIPSLGGKNVTATLTDDNLQTSTFSNPVTP